MTFRALPAAATVSILFLAAAVSAQTADTASATTSVSKVRIVRLSEVKGAVDLDRSNGRGMEPAITNLPIVEHNRLQTAMGVAEVEFEDNSSLRLGPDSVVEFPELSRSSSGTISSVHLMKGTAYVTLLKTRGNTFSLQFGDHMIAVPPGTHLRLAVNDNDARLAVLDGALAVDTTHGPLEVSKKKTVTLLMSSDVDPTVAKNVEEAPLDTWDKQSSDYHVRLANMAAFGNSGYSYGLSDMMYYGAFADAGGGCGSMWRPYFTSASWDPYSAGAWAFYSGAGYTWVSPYPWGWTPYHYGSWAYCPGTGWGWQPGGAWSGLNNTMIAMNRLGNRGGPTSPISPPHPPQPGSPSMVAVISKPLVRSEMTSGNSFMFRNDSAGFGIPRGELGSLNKFSNHVASRGTVSTTVYLSESPSAPGLGGVRPTGQGIGAVSVHRGSPPPPRETNMSSTYAGGSLGGGSSQPASSAGSGMAPRPSPAPAPAPSSGGKPH